MILKQYHLVNNCLSIMCWVWVKELICLIRIWIYEKFKKKSMLSTIYPYCFVVIQYCGFCVPIYIINIATLKKATSHSFISSNLISLLFLCATIMVEAVSFLNAQVILFISSFHKHQGHLVINFLDLMFIECV